MKVIFKFRKVWINLIVFKEKNRRNNIKQVFLAIIFLSVLVMFLSVILKIKNNTSNVLRFNKSWTYYTIDNKDKKRITLPYIAKEVAKGDRVIIENIIPEKLMDLPSLLFWIELSNVTVYLDEEKIYPLNKDDLQVSREESDGRWVIIDLPKGSEGKKLTLEYSSQYNEINIFSVSIADKSKYILNLISEYGDDIVRSIIVLCGGMLFIFVAYALRKSDVLKLIVLYLGIIDILYGTWVLSGNKLIQIFYDGKFILSEINILSLYLLPIMLLIFIKEVLGYKKTKLLNVNIGVLSLYAIFSMLLHCMDIIHFKEHIKVFHLILILSIINLLVFLIKSRKVSLKRRRWVKVFFAFFLLAAITDISLYYRSVDFKYNSITMKIVLILTIVYSYKSVLNYVELENQKKESNIYKRLAFTDTLTGIPNRLAFDNKMEDINANLKNNIETKIFVFDLNNLKKVNDTLGHTVGDRYIIDSSRLLKKIFNDYGVIYRVGGDEFVFISEREIPVGKCIEELDRNCTFVYEGIDSGISYGYEMVTYNTDNVYEVYSMADKEMYNKKSVQKQKQVYREINI